MPAQHPLPGSHSHLKHRQQHRQQLSVRPASSSAGVLTPSSMSDSPHSSRRKPPEDFCSLRQMGVTTAQQSQLLPGGAGGGGAGNMRRWDPKDATRRSMEDSDSAGSPSFPNQSNLNSSDPDVGMNAPPGEGSEEDVIVGGWTMQFRPSGASRGSTGSAAPGGAGGARVPMPVRSVGETSGDGIVGPEYIDYLDYSVGINNNFACATYSILQGGGGGEGEGDGDGEDGRKYLSPGGVSRFSSHIHKHRFRGSMLGLNRSRIYGGGSGALDSTEESNSDSFRSVIDDLTIKNKKLKRRLKKLEGLQGGNLQDEKLFEVRIHGLSLSKKQELERILQGFASNLDKQEVPVPTSNSTSRNADSAYASNPPRSGSGSVVPKPRSVATPMSTSSSERAVSRARNNPLPADMEKHKMKLVVSRLETLFTGFKSSKVPPGQYLESEPGSAVDRESRKRIPEEGAREAPIMSPSQDERIAESVNAIAGVNPNERQRPTHPTDIDPFRPQVADENIEYLANMTSSSSKDNTKLEGHGDGWFYLNLITNMAQLHQINVTVPFVRKSIKEISSKLELSPDGSRVRWKGGNEGTRLSSSESSGSADSPSSGEGSPDAWSKSTPDSNLKDLISVEPPTSGSGRSSRDLSLNRSSSVDKSQYEPIFPRSGTFDDDSSSAMSTSLGSYDLIKRGSSDESTGLSGSSGKRKGLSLNGPIIYYGGGNFCTDLSAQKIDGDPSNIVTSRPGYERFTNNPIGEKQRGAESPTKFESPLFARAPAVTTSSDESMVDDSADADSDVGLQFSPRFSSSSEPPATPPTPMELEVSGIGGIFPEDNFAINVQTKHFLVPQNAKGALPLPRANASKSRILNLIGHHIPMSSIKAFETGGGMDEGEEEEESRPGLEGEGSGEESSEEDSESSEEASTCSKTGKGILKRPVFRGHKFLRPVIVSAKTLQLPPSQLPPANFICRESDDTATTTDSDSGSGIGPQSSSSDDYFNFMGRMHPSDIYGNHPDDYDSEMLARSGLRIYRPVRVDGACDVGSSAATAGDASGNSSPAVGAAAIAVDPPKMNLLGAGATWSDSASADEQMLSTGDEQFGILTTITHDRPNLKRGRASGSERSSANHTPVLKKNPRK